jgi:hypothetical protein
MYKKKYNFGYYLDGIILRKNHNLRLFEKIWETCQSKPERKEATFKHWYRWNNIYKMDLTEVE